MSGDWLEQFEVRLESLERVTVDIDSTLTDVLRCAQLAAAALVDAAQCDIFLAGRSKIDHLGGFPRAEPGDQEAIAQEIRNQLDGHVPARSDDSDSEILLHAVRELGATQRLICRFTGSQPHAPPASCQEGAEAISGLVGNYVGRHLLERSQQRLERQGNLVRLVASVAASSSFEKASAVIATEAPGAVGESRVSVLRRTGESFRLLSSTGTTSPATESQTVRAIEAFAKRYAASANECRWFDVDEINSGENDDPCVAGDSHVSAMIAVTGEPAETSAYCLVVESFETHGCPEIDEVVELFRVTSSTMEYRSHQKLLPRMWRSANRFLRNTLIGILIVLALCLWPSELEIEVEGQIEPTQWRRIYAPDDGTIEDVLFDDETTVSADQTLLRISNSDRDQGLQKVLGDIETTMAQLAAARTRRIVGDDPQASIDEQVLQTRLSSLEADRDLLSEQVNRLSVPAPFSGVVYIRNPGKELKNRPVQRGQMLMRVVSLDTEWQLDLDIPDYLRRYIATQVNNPDQDVRVRYLIRAAPDEDRSAVLTQLSHTIQLVDGSLICRGVADPKDLPAVHRRPGASVVARIQCGRSNLGFVMFREVVEFWQRFRFSWL